MPHILLMGPGLPPDDLRRRLAAWGLTSARGGGADHHRRPTVADCDAVLWYGAPPAPIDGADTEPAAPIVVVGDSDPHGLAWRVIAPRKAAGDCLRRVLETGFARTRALREVGVAAPMCERYRDFLGHELRSPLTAIRTALEEIAACPAEPGPLPEIALRNVDRLHRVLEWSQDLLALADLPRSASDEALRRLAATAPWFTDAADLAPSCEPEREPEPVG